MITHRTAGCHACLFSDAVIVTSSLMAMDRNTATFFWAVSSAVEVQTVQFWRMQRSDAQMCPMRNGGASSAQLQSTSHSCLSL